MNEIIVHVADKLAWVERTGLPGTNQRFTISSNIVLFNIGTNTPAICHAIVPDLAQVFPTTFSFSQVPNCGNKQCLETVWSCKGSSHKFANHKICVVHAKITQSRGGATCRTTQCVR